MVSLPNVNHNNSTKTIMPITRLNQAKYLFSLFIIGNSAINNVPKASVMTIESFAANVSKMI